MNYSLLGSSVHGISQARILEWVAISFSRGSSEPRGQTHISYIGRQSLYHKRHLGSPNILYTNNPRDHRAEWLTDKMNTLDSFGVLNQLKTFHGKESKKE